jgi:glucose/arabinose dehydrogenase
LPVAAAGDYQYLNGGKVAVQSVDGVEYVYASTGGSDLMPALSQSLSSSLSSYGYAQNGYGKIVRFETSATPPVSPTVFACGFRNSFGFDFHPTAGTLYAMDNGNEGKNGSAGAAAFPWYDSLDRVLQNSDQGYGYGYESAECTTSVTGPIWTDTGELAQIAEAPAGAVFYTNEQIPQLQNSLLVVGNDQQDVYQFAVDEYGSTPGQLLAAPSAVTGATLPSLVFAPTDIAQGPDGCIYVNAVDANTIPLYIYRFKPTTPGAKCM